MRDAAPGSLRGGGAEMQIGGHMSAFCCLSVHCLPRAPHAQCPDPLVRKTAVSGGGSPSECEISPLTPLQRPPGLLSQVMDVNPLGAGGAGRR